MKPGNGGFELVGLHVSERPSVSVIVTIYEEQEFLPLVLSAIAEQDYPGRVEIIVCDDGSPTPQLPAIRDFVENTPVDLRYFWQPNRGRRVARSRNNGARCATGELLVFLDGDIIIGRDYVSRHVCAHIPGRLRLVLGSRRWIFVDPARLAILREKPIQESIREFDRDPYVSEQPYQWRVACSSQGWLSCFGGLLSAPNRPEVRFDERFIGWGFEDTELGLRLQRSYGYELFSGDLIEGYHLVRGTFESISVMTRLNTHEQIVAFHRNLLFFHAIHPEVDLSYLQPIVLSLEVDPETNRWKRLHRASQHLRTLTEALEAARIWLARYSPEAIDVVAAGKPQLSSLGDRPDETMVSGDRHAL